MSKNDESKGKPTPKTAMGKHDEKKHGEFAYSLPENASDEFSALVFSLTGAHALAGKRVAVLSGAEGACSHMLADMPDGTKPMQIVHYNSNNNGVNPAPIQGVKFVSFAFDASSSVHDAVLIDVPWGKEPAGSLPQNIVLGPNDTRKLQPLIDDISKSGKPVYVVCRPVGELKSKVYKVDNVVKGAIDCTDHFTLIIVEGLPPRVTADPEAPPQKHTAAHKKKHSERKNNAPGSKAASTASSSSSSL
jgi:hypothetical protein